MADRNIVTAEEAESMGISQPAFEEIRSIIGRMPTIDELSTLLAMWNANGRHQSLYGWLKGQHHVVERNEYIYNGSTDDYKRIQEPKIKECVDIAKALYPANHPPLNLPQFQPSSEIFIVGNINTEFLNSRYASQYLHLVDNPISMGSIDDDLSYHQMILNALHDNAIVRTQSPILQGGLFNTLIESCRTPNTGFDILSCREIRLDAFLFGEEPGRLLVTIPDDQEDYFLIKLDEAKINSFFLGRTTKGRIVIDGMDFGPTSNYIK